MVGKSWHPGCPVGLDYLRLVTLSYWGFDAAAHTGQLVVNSDSVTPVVRAFRALYQGRFPIRRMRPVDYYGGDDEQSMAADNTSAFNCRLVPGTTTWSQHAYGRAVDLDPLENPEIQNGQIDPPSASLWANRARSDPAMIRHGDTAWQAFTAVGWKWGGDWTSLKDYMHFSANGL
jgi:D-alanyl-D-alanine carboxypeptidase